MIARAALHQSDSIIAPALKRPALSATHPATRPRSGGAAQRDPAPRPQTNQLPLECRGHIRWQTTVVYRQEQLSALRADATGGRAYGVGVRKKHRPVFDLRGATVAPSGNHNIRAWVTRRDSGNLRLRRHGAWAQLAWVTP